MKFKEFIIQIDLIILGLSISSSIELLKTNFSLQTTFLFFISITMCINFFYAKICELTQLTHSLKTLYINFVKLLPLCFVSLSIDNLLYFLYALIILRIADIVGILIDENFQFKRLPKMTKQWIYIDALCLLYLIPFVINESVYRVISSFWISLLLVLLWLVDIIFDYRMELKELLNDVFD